jgi:hypothetical protein
MLTSNYLSMGMSLWMESYKRLVWKRGNLVMRSCGNCLRFNVYEPEQEHLFDIYIYIYTSL